MHKDSASRQRTLPLDSRAIALTISNREIDLLVGVGQHEFVRAKGISLIVGMVLVIELSAKNFAIFGFLKSSWTGTSPRGMQISVPNRRSTALVLKGFSPGSIPAMS